MRGLTVIVSEPDRLRIALELAAATAALGGRGRVFCHGEAVAALRAPLTDPANARQRAAGLPDLATLLDEALALGTQLMACQSGLHLTGTDAASLDSRIETSGLLSVLQTLGDDRLLCA